MKQNIEKVKMGNRALVTIANQMQTTQENMLQAYRKPQKISQSLVEKVTGKRKVWPENKKLFFLLLNFSISFSISCP